MSGLLTHRIVIPGIGSSFAPGDPDPLPDTDFWITSRRGAAYHGWIADDGSGRPDYSADGQRIDPITGRVEDGEVQSRVIDVAAPIAAVACDINSVLVPEGHADLHLDSTAFTSGKWTRHSNTDPTYKPESDWGVTAAGPGLGTFALFFWVDDPGGPPYTLGPITRKTWIEATFDGTEGGGVAWTPGQKVGFRFRVNWTLDTGLGNVFVELEGAGGPVRVSGPTPSFNFWDMPVDPLNNQVDLVVYAVADASGEVIVRLGAEGMAPSFNLAVQFTDLEVVECDDVIVSVDAERYVTGWLADADARQQMLGRRFFLEESTDGGVTYTAVVYSGFLKDATMEESLTWLLSAGDSGRSRRLGRAWAGLDPIEDFT